MLIRSHCLKCKANYDWDTNTPNSCPICELSYEAGEGRSVDKAYIRDSSCCHLSTPEKITGQGRVEADEVKDDSPTGLPAPETMVIC